MGCPLWHNRCVHDGLVHVVLLGYGQNGRPRPTVNVDDFVGSCSDDYGRHCRCCTVCNGRSDRESASRRDRAIASQLCGFGQSSRTCGSDFAVWFMGRGRIASSAARRARDVPIVTHRFAAGSDCGAFHRVESGVAAIAVHLDRSIPIGAALEPTTNSIGQRK
jgi:hypothetical protein